MNSSHKCNRRFNAEEYLIRPFIAETFSSSLWLNPKMEAEWPYTRTIQSIQEIFPMFELTLDGLEEAVTFMTKKN